MSLNESSVWSEPKSSQSGKLSKQCENTCRAPRPGCRYAIKAPQYKKPTEAAVVPPQVLQLHELFIQHSTYM